MTELVFVRPAEGGLVRMPDKGSTIMPKDGLFVPRSSYYERLIVTGDIVVDENRKFEPPKPEEERAPAAVIDQPVHKTEAPASQTRGVRK